MNATMQALGSVVIFALIGASIYWQFSRSRAIQEGWARENGYTLVSREYRTFRKGPFTWTTSRNQTVYYVSVRDSNNRLRYGWVRCGGWWRGVWTNQAEVEWDDQSVH
jgi:hypothetical protein